MNAELAAALVSVQGEMKDVHKGREAEVRSKKGTYRYSYASFEDVVSQARSVLSKHGLAFFHTQGDASAPAKLRMRCLLVHKSGESIESWAECTSPFDAQSVGSAHTYLRRYTLLAALGIAASDDDDGAAATTEARSPANTDGHHPGWAAGGNRWFCAQVGDMSREWGIKFGYEEVATWCQSVGKPRPSSMTPDNATALIRYMSGEQGRSKFLAWLSTSEG